jgi:hypothetical protein
MTVEISKAIRSALKAAGYGKADVSVHNDSYSMGSTVYVKIKRPEISLSKVEAIADPFARVDRDSATGEILGGGNCFVDVAYADGALDAAAARIEEQVAAGRRHFGPCELVVKDPFTYQVWHNQGDDERDNVGRAGMHIDRKSPGPGLARELAKIGQLDTLEQWAGIVNDDVAANGNDDVDALVERCRDVAAEMFDSKVTPGAPPNAAQAAHYGVRLVEPKRSCKDEYLAALRATLRDPDTTDEMLTAVLEEYVDRQRAEAAVPSAEAVAEMLHGALDPHLVAAELRVRGFAPPDISFDGGSAVTLTVAGGVYRITVERAPPAGAACPGCLWCNSRN